MCNSSPLEKCFKCIINYFHQYSIRVDHHDRLSKGELKKMMEEQMPTYLKSKKDPKGLDQLFEELDMNKDKELSFEEFMVLIARVLCLCHEKIHQKEGQGHGHGHGHSHGPKQDHGH